jgi:carbon storage regulator
MLVLSRKTKEQIMIGDDVCITLLRIDANKVRIGIEAPKEVRVIRSEIADREAKMSDETIQENAQISDREQAFAHPQAPAAKNRLGEAKLFVGSVDRKGQHARLQRAPLSDYMTAI